MNTNNENRNGNAVPETATRSVVVTLRGDVPNNIKDLVEMLGWMRKHGEVMGHVDDNDRVCDHELGRYGICKKCGVWPPAIERWATKAKASGFNKSMIDEAVRNALPTGGADMCEDYRSRVRTARRSA